MNLDRVFVLLFMFLGMNMGAYDMVLNQITSCVQSGKGNLNLAFRPYIVKQDGKKTQLFRGSLSFPFSKEQFNALVLHGEFFQKKNNNYLSKYKYDGKACAAIETFAANSYKNFKKRIGVVNKECAIPPGNYTLDAWKAAFSPSPLAMLEYGSYKVVMQVLLRNKLVGCVEFLGDLKRKA